MKGLLERIQHINERKNNDRVLQNAHDYKYNLNYKNFLSLFHAATCDS